MFARLFGIGLLLTTPFFAQIDFEKGLKQAYKESKPLILFFNGSDFSVESMKMKKEIFDSPEFQQKTSERFVFVEVDLPKHRKQAAENVSLQERFMVDQLPCVIILSPQEKEIARLTYVEESASQFADELSHIVAMEEKLSSGLAHLNTLSADEIIESYKMAQELSNSPASKALIGAGLSTAHKGFFLLEKYRNLLDEGKLASEEAITLKKELIALDPCNDKKLHYSIALLDFQALAKNSSDPKDLTKPLLAYQARFGSNWQLEMLLAQVYLNYDQPIEALSHAEKALSGAPLEKKTEITHSIDYIKSRTFVAIK